MLCQFVFRFLCLDEAVETRENVFVKEQGFEKEFDEIDEKAIHLVMFVNIYKNRL